MVVILDFSPLLKKMKMFVRDRAILIEFLTSKVVQFYVIEEGKISNFSTFGGHLHLEPFQVNFLSLGQ